tara:strand:+ start:246 stop:509 length:264 start_codon:yes stop_codon:yes gene_type:complete
MKLSLQELRRLVNQEVKKNPLQEKRRKLANEEAGIPDEIKEDVSEALELLEMVAEDSDDPDELRWYLTKIGEMFGMDPIEEDEDEDQ